MPLWKKAEKLLYYQGAFYPKTIIKEIDNSKKGFENKDSVCRGYRKVSTGSSVYSANDDRYTDHGSLIRKITFFAASLIISIFDYDKPRIQQKKCIAF